MEQTRFSGRLSEALEALKFELMEIREQDVGLMKQLLTMENSIKTLKPRKTNILRKTKDHKRRRTGIVTLLPEVKEDEISLSSRRGSCCSSEGSISSADELSLSSDDSDLEDREEVVDYSSSTLPQTSFYHKKQLNEFKLLRGINDEHLLISNIKVWKYKQSQLKVLSKK